MTASPTLPGSCGIIGSVRLALMATALMAVLVTPRAFAGEPTADDMVDVTVDRSRLIKVPDRVATIVIGNPLIADASLQGGGLLVITGKGYGTTNLIVLDRKGNALMEKIVQVHGPRQDVVVVYKGINRETWNCAPTCNPTITLGDFQQFFAQNLAQTSTRSSQALSIGTSR